MKDDRLLPDSPRLHWLSFIEKHNDLAEEWQEWVKMHLQNKRIRAMVIEDWIEEDSEWEEHEFTVEDIDWEDPFDLTPSLVCDEHRVWVVDYGTIKFVN